jgi:hypothetical protein
LPKYTEDYLITKINLPTKDTKNCTGLPDGETWTNINECLRNGFRGLAGGSSLVDLKQRYFGIKTPLTEKIIAEAIGIFHKKHQRYPGSRDSDTSGLPAGDSWAGIISCLHYGNRGLSPGNSIGKIIAKYFGAKGCLSEKRIVDMMLAWNKKYKIYPNQNTKGKPDKFEGSWASIDNALAKGLRGLRGGSSLAKLRKKYGLANPTDMRFSTLAECKKWVRANNIKTCSEYWSAKRPNSFPADPEKFYKRKNANWKGWKEFLGT